MLEAVGCEDLGRAEASEKGTFAASGSTGLDATESYMCKYAYIDT